MTTHLDIGFRVLKIEDSVFEPINETQQRIRDFCGEQDALFEIMTRVGIDLTAPTELMTLTCSKRVWLAGNLDAMDAIDAWQSGQQPQENGQAAPKDPPAPLLIVCLERNLQDVHPRTFMLDIARLAVPNHTIFVFLDAAFGPPDDLAWQAVRQNVIARLKQNDVEQIIAL